MGVQRNRYKTMIENEVLKCSRQDCCSRMFLQLAGDIFYICIYVYIILILLLIKKREQQEQPNNGAGFPDVPTNEMFPVDGGNS